MTPTIEALADGLSKAQRRMILAIGDGQPIEFALGQAGFALLRKKLVFINMLGARHLTDEGHTLRRLLQEREGR